MTPDAACRNCGAGIYRGQNYPMDGGWHWLHVVSGDRRCLMFAEPGSDSPRQLGERVVAFAVNCVEVGDMTPGAARMLSRLVDEELTRMNEEV